MTSSAEFAPRVITIYCQGKQLHAEHGTEAEHEAVELAALVSYAFEGSEWWDADDRAERQPMIMPDTEETRARPDLAVALARNTQRFIISCPRCPRTFPSGDLLGAGYRTGAQVLQEHRAGITSAMRHERQRRTHAKLSTAADNGVLSLSLSALCDILT